MFNIFSNLFGASSNNEEIVSAIKSGAALVDVRTSGEYASGHVKGSLNIPLDVIGSQSEKLKKYDKIVVFCRSGNRSGQAKSILENKGFQHVYNAGTWQTVNNIVNS